MRHDGSSADRLLWTAVLLAFNPDDRHRVDVQVGLMLRWCAN